MEYWIKQHTCGFPYISLNYMGLKYYVDRGSGGTCGTFRSVPEAVAACGQALLPRGTPYDRQFTFVTAQGGECKGGRALDRAAVVWGSGHPAPHQPVWMPSPSMRTVIPLRCHGLPISPKRHRCLFQHREEI